MQDQINTVSEVVTSKTPLELFKTQFPNIKSLSDLMETSSWDNLLTDMSKKLKAHIMDTSYTPYDVYLSSTNGTLKDFLDSIKLDEKDKILKNESPKLVNRMMLKTIFKGSGVY